MSIEDRRSGSVCSNRGSQSDPFPLERILEIDKDTYLRSIGRADKDYNFKAIIVEGEEAHLLTETFSRRIPKGSECVVGVHRVFYDDGEHKVGNIYGTALVPQERKIGGPA